MTTWPEMPDCGVYLVWPTEGTAWIHPDDLDLANHWIPSDRVFRRTDFDGEFYRLEYGSDSIRVKPTLWLKVSDQGFTVGDRVEVLSRFLANTPCIGTIAEIRFDHAAKEIVYHICEREQILPRHYRAADLGKLTVRAQLRESYTTAPTPRQIEVPGLDRLAIDMD